jgi:DNA (cytosine-5)-methyltransferase 1
VVAADSVSERPVRVRLRDLGMSTKRGEDGTRIPRKPRAVDLFCGAGGLSQGLRQAGFDVVGAVDLDGLACATYRLNHTSVKLWERDIRQLTGTAVMKELGIRRGQLELLAACPPCQGFSTMRTKNGTRRNRDARNDLVFEVLRLVRSIRPQSVMLENVPGLSFDRRYVAFRKGLETLGYRVTADVLNTVDFNVPQRRRRLVVLASRNQTPEFAPKAKARQTVRQAIAALPSPSRSRDALHNYSPQLSRKVKDLIKEIPRNGGSRSDRGAQSQLCCHKRLQGFHDVYGRMAWDKAAPTITGGCINPSKGRFLHPRANRPITLREAALLQTFPRSYRFSLERGRYPAAVLIGNALPPEFIRRHAAALRKTGLAKRS